MKNQIPHPIEPAVDLYWKGGLSIYRDGFVASVAKFGIEPRHALDEFGHMPELDVLSVGIREHLESGHAEGERDRDVHVIADAAGGGSHRVAGDVYRAQNLT